LTWRGNPDNTDPVRVLRVILVLGACLHLTGGHYGVLQCIAWANMLINYSAQDGFLEGAKKTFDGEHPCCMCKSIAKAKQSEQRQDAPAIAKLNLSVKETTLPSTVRLKTPAPVGDLVIRFAAPWLESAQWTDSPPFPPPRLASA
jgi:hypothetical protein